MVDDAEALRRIENYKKRLREVGEIGSGRSAASGSSGAAKLGQDFLSAEKKALSLYAAASKLATLPRARGFEYLAQSAQMAAARADDLQSRLRRVSLAASRSSDQSYLSKLSSQAEVLKRELRDVDRQLSTIRQIDQRSGFSAAGSRARAALTSSFSPTAAIQGTAIGGAAFLGINLAEKAIDRTVKQTEAYRQLSAAALEAGQSVEFLTGENKRFAALTGISNTQASSTTSLITRLATNSGNTSQEYISKLLNAFADLGAARGIKGTELKDLIGTILSGQDEGLNRLGISDPGKLYQAYAKQIGVTVDSLTQFQKVQAATNAVLEKAGIFAGSAERRMNSLDGQIAQSKAAWENLADGLSRSFTTSGPVTDFLTEASRLLKELTIDLDKVNKELEKGRKPRDIAKELYPGPGIGDYISGAAASIPAVPLYLYDLATEGSATAKLRLDYSINPYQRRFDELTNKIAEQAASNQAQKAGTEKQSSEQKLKKVDDALAAIEKSQAARAKAIYDDRQKYLSTAYEVEEAKLKLHLARVGGSEIESLKAIGDLKQRSVREQLAADETYYRTLIGNARSGSGEIAKWQKELADLTAQRQTEIKLNAIATQTAIIEKLREAKKAASELFVQSFGSRNPFVRVFDDAAKAIDTVRERTQGLSREIRESLLNLTRSDNAVKLMEARFRNSLEAYGLRSDAKEFRAGKKLEDTDENLQNKLRDEFGLIGATRSDLFSNTYNILANGALELIRRPTDAGADARQAAIDRQVIELTRGLDPGRLTPELNQIAASAREREARRLSQNEDTARQVMTKLNSLLQNVDTTGSLPVSIKDGSHIVKVVNKSDRAEVSSAPSQQDTDNSYGSPR